MVSCELARVVRQLRRIVQPPLPDAQVLEKFAQQGDPAAFEVLLARHGPMVLALCKRLLRNVHDAEDAFQATFLVLVRKAGSLRERDLLGNWLYGVAYRIAVRVRANNARRNAVETLDADRVANTAGPFPADQELRWLLQEELNRLPDKYRLPVVLCYLEGHTNAEAARRLHWPLGTVKGRLTRARELLRRRLTRRGVTLSSAALAAALSNPVLALPPPLIVSTVKAALGFTAGDAAALGGPSASVLGLVKGSLRAMWLARLNLVAAVALTVAVLVPGAGMLVRCALVSEGFETKSNSPAAKTLLLPQAKAPESLPDTVDLKARLVPGLPFYQEINIETKQTMKVMQKDIVQHQSLTFWTCWTPMPKEDGHLVVNLKIIGAKMDVELGGAKIKFDSTARNQPVNALANLIRAFKGAELKVYLNGNAMSDKYLTPVKVEGREALLQKLIRLDKTMEPQLRIMLSEPAFNGILGSATGALPGRTVRKGDTWSASSRTDMGPIGQYLSTFHYTYQGPAGSLDRINVKTSLKYTPPPNGENTGLPFTITKANLKSRAGSGVVLFDRVRGRIAQATLDTTIEGTLQIDIGGMNTQVEVIQIQRTTSKTSDTNPLE